MKMNSAYYLGVQRYNHLVCDLCFVLDFKCCHGICFCLQFFVAVLGQLPLSLTMSLSWDLIVSHLIFNKITKGEYLKYILSIICYLHKKISDYIV